MLRVEAHIADPGRLVMQQRLRLANVLAGLDDSQWEVASRCEGWSVKDVVAHLVGTNQFWTVSMSAGLAGSPTRMLAAFDPVTTPAAMVDATRDQPAAQILADYCASLDQLGSILNELPAGAWSAVGESPPGHVELRAVALHALWDAWIHEGDILVPLDLPRHADNEEIRACLIYAAVIGPTLLALRGSTQVGRLAIEGTTPDTSLAVDVGPTVTVRDRGRNEAVDAELHGSAVDLIEGLTFRTPLEHRLSPEHEWLLGTLAQTFDRV